MEWAQNIVLEPFFLFFDCFFLVSNGNRSLYFFLFFLFVRYLCSFFHVLFRYFFLYVIWYRSFLLVLTRTEIATIFEIAMLVADLKNRAISHHDGPCWAPSAPYFAKKFIIFCCLWEWDCTCSCCQVGSVDLQSSGSGIGKEKPLGPISRPCCPPLLCAPSCPPLMSALKSAVNVALNAALKRKPWKIMHSRQTGKRPQNTPRATPWAPLRADPCGTAGQKRLLWA